jgi:hypothetical protein
MAIQGEQRARGWGVAASHSAGRGGRSGSPAQRKGRKHKGQAITVSPWRTEDAVAKKPRRLPDIYLDSRTTADGSWWTTAGRDGFTSKAEQHVPRMRQSKFSRVTLTVGTERDDEHRRVKRDRPETQAYPTEGEAA